MQQHLGAARHGVIAVCGATGEVGGRVAAGLSERGLPIRLIVRDPARAPQLDGAEIAVAAGYHDTDEMTEALRGAETVFMVSGRESPNRLDEHKSAVLSEEGHEGRAYTLTGGSAMTLAEAAALLGESIGRGIVDQPATIEEAYASRAGTARRTGALRAG